jgi:hypothetical protein
MRKDYERKVRRHQSGDALVKASIQNALKVFRAKYKVPPTGSWEITGRVVVRPAGAIERDRIGNTSGCYIFEVCMEDETTLTSHCEEQEKCGEWPAID